MDLSHLNKSQRKAVVNTAGPVMILAGAGSGKTRTLVSRIEYLLNEQNVSPFRILAVTFSNKAAREMRERIAAGNDIDFGAIQVTTFHSFCARVLRNEAQYLGLSRSFTIYDTSESKSIIKAILGRRGIKTNEIHPNEVQHYIDSIKNLGFYLSCTDDETLDEIDKDELFYSFFQEYEAELHKSNAVDFGSLITGVLQLFEQFPEVLERYQKRFHYLLVDEYQDTNRAQFRLVKLLAEYRKNICVVGDEDQSIYSWRGADIRNILDFEKIFPEAELIKLEQNYRSSKNIIDAASCVISKNIQRKGKKMWTSNEEGESINIIECPDDKTEAQYIADEILDLIQAGINPNEVAVFYRTNAQSRLIEDALRRSNTSYRVVAGIKFYERKEIKDMLAYLRCLVNEKDSLAISRIINTPTRGIGARTLRKIEDEAIKQSISLWEMICEIVDNLDKYKFLKLSAKVKSGLASLVTLIQESQILMNNGEKPSRVYEKLLHESGYLESLEVERTYEAQGRIENLEELLTAIVQFEDIDESPTIVGFLETITLDSEMESDDGPREEVSLMTIHGSKGLEYSYVFVVGVEETIFPSFQSMDDGEQGMEEERRLFYVAMTRAMKKLFITFAQGRMLWGQVRFNPPSRFLDEIPEEYYEWFSVSKGGHSAQKTGPSRKNNSDFDFSDEYSQDSNYNEYESTNFIQRTSERPKSKFPQGSCVNHKLYGEGTIIETDGIGDDEKVVIKFRDGARKKFLVRFAPLELINE